MKQPTRPATELPGKAPTPPRLIPYAAALLCAALLVCISHPTRHATSYAAGDDETAWQGIVTVISKTNQESDKSENHPPFSEHRVHRYRRDTTATYTGFHILPENEEMRSWRGPANVNLTMNGSHYTFDTSTFVGPNATTYEENGYDTTTTGATVAQGEVKFFRYRNQDDPRKTKCRIEVDALDNSWRDRPELKIWEVGRSWSKEVRPEFPTGAIRPIQTTHVWDKAVKQQQTLAPNFVGVSFDCDPKAVSYSGQQDTWKGSPTSSQVVTWNIHRGAVPETEVELVPPKEYERWVPEAGEDEETLGNFIDVGIEAHKKGNPGADPPKKVLKYKIKLEDTSHEKGVDLNWPPKSRAKDTPDMKLDKDNPWIKLTDDKGQSAETKEEGLTKFMVTVNSHDWGGYTKLRVTAELEDHSTVVAHVRGHPDQESLAIPKDDNSNHIADWWEHCFEPKDPNATADDDADPPGDTDKGDGISLYEEYRGFHIQGKHEQLSPDLKDVFIWDWDGLGPGAYTQSGFQIHSIQGLEKAFESGAINEKVINPNRGYGTLGPAYVIEMRRAVLDKGGTGETLPPQAAHVPKNVQLVRIDVGAIRQGFGSGKKQEAANELNATIGHELGHASNLPHHGEGVDYNIQPPGDVLCRKADGTVQKLPCKTEDCFGVAAPHGAYSGDTNCLLRYNSTDFYEDPAGNCEWTFEGKKVHGRPFGYEPPGTIYCTSPKGSSPAGDAQENHGECKSRLCINSLKH